jgi:hypothetical protein
MSHVRSDSHFWMYETSGVLRPAVRAYIKGTPMTAKDIAAIRTYLRVWVFAPEFGRSGSFRPKPSALLVSPRSNTARQIR